MRFDYSRRDVLSISVKPARPPDQTAPEMRTGGFSVEELQTPAQGRPPLPPQFAILKPPVEQEEPLHAELRSFLEATRRLRPPVVTLQDGRRALAVALDILTQIEAHAKQAKLENLSQ